jgi:Tol biopolymer transport system component
MTNQGSAHGRFQRAIRNRNVAHAEIAALLALFLALSGTAVAAGVATPAGGGGGASAPAVPAVVYAVKGDVYAVAVDGSRRVRLTRTRAPEYCPALSANRRRLAFVTERGALMTMRLDGTDRRLVTRDGGCDTAWAPSGRTIFFVRYRRRNEYAAAWCGAIFRVGAGGGPVRRVTAGYAARPRFTRSHEDPAVSPDGRRLAFTDNIGCGEGGTSYFRLRVVDLNGRPTRDLAGLRQTWYLERRDPSWAPDRTRLVYQRQSPRRGSELATVSRDGSDERRLVKGADSPSWSPGGHWIAFTRRARRDDQLFVVRPDGSGIRSLARVRLDNLGNSSLEVAGWLPRVPQ